MKTNDQGMIITRDPDFLLRIAVPEDAELIYDYAHRLASFQHMDHIYTTTPEDARRLIAAGEGEVVFGYYKGQVVGFMYFMEKSSIFIGQNGLFIDMLFIDETMRGKGLGKIFLAFLAQLARERGCRRLEWCCMDWNQPAIDFYASQGANRVEEMHTYRLSADLVEKLADSF